MKRLLVLAGFLLLGTAALAADNFWEQLTPAERAAAGLGQLTPEQQAALNALAERFAKDGASHAIAAATARVKAEAKAEAKAEVKAEVMAQAKAEAKAEVLAEVKEKKKTTIGLPPREDDETEVVRARISGEFRGWTGHTTFRLDNGQAWQQETPDNRFFPLMMNPEVDIRPSRLGGWKMTLLKEGLWIRVKRLH